MNAWIVVAAAVNQQVNLLDIGREDFHNKPTWMVMWNTWPYAKYIRFFFSLFSSTSSTEPVDCATNEWTGFINFDVNVCQIQRSFELTFSFSRTRIEKSKKSTWNQLKTGGLTLNRNRTILISSFPFLLIIFFLYSLLLTCYRLPSQMRFYFFRFTTILFSQRNMWACATAENFYFFFFSLAVHLIACWMLIASTSTKYRKLWYFCVKEKMKSLKNWFMNGMNCLKWKTQHKSHTQYTSGSK